MISSALSVLFTLGLPFTLPSQETALKIFKQIPVILETAYSEKLDSLSLTLHLSGATSQKSATAKTAISRHCKSIVYGTLKKLPPQHIAEINDLTLTFSNKGRRGLSGGHKMIVRCSNVSDDELSAVIIHETGHIADTGYFLGDISSVESGFYDFEKPVFSNDTSLNFYRISWVNSGIRKKNSNELDFVSKYASTDPFEDFAETYLFYRLHGAEFRFLTRVNEALLAKYTFMKEHVFDFEEFGSGEKEVPENFRISDATVYR